VFVIPKTNVLKFDKAKKQSQVLPILNSKGNRFSVNCELYCAQGQHKRQSATLNPQRQIGMLIGFNVMLWSMPLSFMPLPMGWRHQGLTKVHRQTKPKWTYERVDWTVLSACSLNSEMSSDVYCCFIVCTETQFSLKHQNQNNKLYLTENQIHFG